MIKNNKGFTLIEIIAVLIIGAITAAIVGLGLVQIMKGYIFTKQNAEGVLKAQVAMTRIIKEIALSTSISATPAPTATNITYTRIDNITNSLTFSGGEIKINNDTLLDNVTQFAMSYYDVTDTATTIASAIRRVDVTFTSTMADGTASQFANSIYIYERF